MSNDAHAYTPHTTLYGGVIHAAGAEQGDSGHAAPLWGGPARLAYDGQ